MAAIANSAFELRVSNHMFDTTKNITGMFQEGQTPAAAVCAAGQLVVPGERLPNEGYPQGIVNENAYYMAAAASGAVDFLYACNTFNVQELVDGFGNAYKVGTNILGLAVPAGQRGTYTRLDEGDQIRVGIGNMSAAVGENGFATVSAAGLFTPAAAAATTTGTWYFEIIGTGNFTQGAYAGFGYVDLKVRRVHTAA